jgi:class 3 adenylate cyclase
MGDGILTYFGFPRAHEDDAARAVHAGLEISVVVDALKTRAREKLLTRAASLRRFGSGAPPATVGEIEAMVARYLGAPRARRARSRRVRPPARI